MALIAIAAFVLLLVVVAMVARPLLQPGPGAPPADDRDTPELLVRKERLLDAIRETDMDLATGKLSTADHADMRAALVAEATEVLEALDEEQPADDGPEPAEDEPPPATDPAPPPVDGTAAGHLEEEIAERRERLRAERSCPGCDAPREDADAFCRRCGAPLASAMEVGS